MSLHLYDRNILDDASSQPYSALTLEMKGILIACRRTRRRDLVQLTCRQRSYFIMYKGRYPLALQNGDKGEEQQTKWKHHPELRREML